MIQAAHCNNNKNNNKFIAQSKNIAAKECAACAGVRAAWGEAWSYGCGEKHRCCSAHVPATTGVVVVAVMTGAMAGAR